MVTKLFELANNYQSLDQADIEIKKLEELKSSTSLKKKGNPERRKKEDFYLNTNKIIAREHRKKGRRADRWYVFWCVIFYMILLLLGAAITVVAEYFYATKVFTSIHGWISRQWLVLLVEESAVYKEAIYYCAVGIMPFIFTGLIALAREKFDILEDFNLLLLIPFYLLSLVFAVLYCFIL